LIYAIPGQTSDCDNIPKGVVEISEGAFLRNKLLRRVNLPDTLQTIGKFAFEECLQLETINPGAFESCLYLEKIILHDGLVSIGNDTFSNCRLLNQITLPKTIRWIGDRAF